MFISYVRHTCDITTNWKVATMEGTADGRKGEVIEGIVVVTKELVDEEKTAKGAVAIVEGTVDKRKGK